MSSTDSTPTPRSQLRQVAIVVLALGTVGLFGLLLSQRPQQEPVPVPVVELPPPPDDDRVPYPDATPVIGVSLGERHRAYLLADLWQPDQHVQNDLFDDVPVSVTFCNLDNCVKAFTADVRGKPLELKVGGPHPDKVRKMLLNLGGRKFEQDTGRPLDGDSSRPFPHAAVPAERTTWGAWRTSHPNTEFRAKGRLYPPAKPKPAERPLP